MEPNKKVRMELPATTHRFLKARAAHEGITLRQLMVQALVDFIEPDVLHGLQDGAAATSALPPLG